MDRSAGVRKTISAIDIQEAFLAAAQAHYRGQDDETDWVLDQWEAVLQDLRGDYTDAGGPGRLGLEVVAARNLSRSGTDRRGQTRP
mgnify:CR=1 FL=1